MNGILCRIIIAYLESKNNTFNNNDLCDAFQGIFLLAAAAAVIIVSVCVVENTRASPM